MQIDLNRLRKFKADATAANDALRAQSERIRNARDDLSRAKIEAARFDDARPASGADWDKYKKAEDAARQRVADLGSHIEQLQAEHDRRERAWNHASTLWGRVRDFAAEQGRLPADLRDQ